MTDKRRSDEIISSAAPRRAATPKPSDRRTEGMWKRRCRRLEVVGRDGRTGRVGLWVSATRPPRPFRASRARLLSPRSRYPPVPSGSSQPLSRRNRRAAEGRHGGEGWRMVVKILLRIVCRPDPPLDVTTGKNRKPPGNRRKNSSGSDLFCPFFVAVPLPRRSPPSRSSARTIWVSDLIGPAMMSRLASS